MGKGNMSAQEKEWQADSDMRTLIEAEKIKKDKERYSAALKAVQKQKAALASVDTKGE